MIRMQDVSKSFRNKHVLRNVDLDLNVGDRVAFVGSNGAGKTTLIRCLLGQYNYGGIIEIEQRDPRKDRQSILNMTGFVPQLPPPIKMPVRQLIDFAAAVCGSQAERIYRISNTLGLNPDAIKHQPFNKLSGGQKQKLLISIALGRDTRILILDEPAANLDPDARHALFGLLAERQNQAAMMISSHRLDEVAPLVNRVVELDQGRIVLNDQVAEHGELNRLMTCRIELMSADRAFTETIRTWGFNSSDSGLIWTGHVASPDSLRFLSVISRYSGLLKAFSLDEKAEPDNAAGVQLHALH